MPKYKQYELKAKVDKNGKRLKPQKKWMVKGYLGIDPKTGKQKETTLRGFKNKTAAEKGFADAVHDFRHGDERKHKSPTIAELYDEWYPLYVPTVAPSTAVLVASVYRRRILPELGDYFVTMFKRADAQRWLNSIATKYRSYQKMISYLSLLFRFAAQNDIIQYNPVRNLAWPRKTIQVSSHQEKNYFTLQELTSFINALDVLKKEKPVWVPRAAILLAVISTGMRMGEALALKWSDIDFKAGTVSVGYHVQIDLENNFTVVEGGKTKTSVRVLRLDPMALSALKEWRRLQFSKIGINKDAWIGTTLAHPDTRTGLSYVRNWMHEVCSVAGVSYISPHGLRHTKATLMAEAGADVSSIAAIMGHSNTSTTIKTYIHATPDGIERAENKYAAMLKSGSKSGSKNILVSKPVLYQWLSR